VSTFYLLPPRPLLGECFAGYLQPLFPGLQWTSAACAELADTLTAVVVRRTDVYVVYREELPDGEDPARALADGFGAEAGDEVIEIGSGGKAGEWTACRWRLGQAA
jgi:hypothetical protein